MVRRSTVAVAGLVGILVVGLLTVQTGAWVDIVGTGEYDETTVTAVDANGTVLGAVDARVADTTTKRYVGLSDTESLDSDEGMLFVNDEAGEHAYVMREMDFPIDIVFVAANGTVTTIHHADVPTNGTGESGLERYRGTGKYVLEVSRGWTNETELDEGDRVVIAGETGEFDDTDAEEADVATNSTDTATATPAGPTVSALSTNGTDLGTVHVRIADDGGERYTGLSDTESLGPNEGMLFVHDEADEHAYVMREMDFPLDIVFAAANGTVTAIHHADVPPEGTEESELERYRGTGKYVLEVNRGWTNETGLAVGDRISVPVTE